MSHILKLQTLLPENDPIGLDGMVLMSGISSICPTPDLNGKRFEME